MLVGPECLSPALVIAALALGVASGSVAAQNAGAAPPSSKPVPCSAADQSAGTCVSAATPGQRFPYPGDQGSDPADAGRDDSLDKGGPLAPTPKTTAAEPKNATGAPAVSGGKQFPYPGDPDPANGSGLPGASSSSSSSNSSSGATDPDDPLDPPATAGKVTPGRRKLPKVKKLQSDEDREAEDVKVAKFYYDGGNALAAYNRLRDATKLMEDDADAWFLLGDVSQKLHKPDEASDAYRKFLALEPNTRRAKMLARAQPDLTAKR